MLIWPIVALVVLLLLVGVLRKRPIEPTPLDLTGMVADETGMPVKILQPGEGPVPVRGSRVRVHYTGWLEDGRKFDSSVDRKRPFTFRLGRGEVITGWDQQVALMHVGEKRRVVIPSQMAYGERRAGMIPPNSNLVFDIELLGIEETA
ncbi:MAG TPA: FKBP-type peptidyl-prolyl cis-trans isomerase [Stenomitos sp.]